MSLYSWNMAALRSTLQFETGESKMTKTTKFLIMFLTAALMVASAASYNVTLFQTSVIGGKELKAGEYKVTVAGDKAIISMGKQKVEAAAKIETADSKFSSTSVRYTSEGGKMKIQEIRLGGTNQKLIFN
jgi:hypothetical protein